MMKIEVRIGEVDMFGFCGRDNHPAETDSGKACRLLAITNPFLSAVGEYTEPNAEEEIEELEIYTVQMADGRIVDLVEHEIKTIADADLAARITHFL